MTSLRGILATLVLGVAAAIVIVAVSIIPFLNPVFVGFEQDRAQAQAWTGWTTAQLRTVTDAVLSRPDPRPTRIRRRARWHARPRCP